MAGVVPGHPSGIRKLVLAPVSCEACLVLPCVWDMGLISGGNLHMFPGSANWDLIHVASLPAWVRMCLRRGT